MNEDDARAVLLLGAFERQGALHADDAHWAGREARRQTGEAASPAQWLVRRARLGLGRLAERDATLKPVLAGALRPAGRLPVLLALVAAFALGLGADALGPGRHVNLLALPLLGLLAWNLAVYLLLAGGGLLRLLRRAGPGDAAGDAAPWEAWHAGQRPVAAGLRRWLLQQLAGAQRQLVKLAATPEAAAARVPLLGTVSPQRQQRALAAFAADWAAYTAPVTAWRGAALLHGAAALLALGLLAGLYARGLVLGYRAGWDSTFLGAEQVQLLLQWLLGPASLLAGLPLPDAAGLEGLRLADGGGGGEGAAPWIHRWALTVVVLVVLPRLALAAWALWRARQLARRLPVPDDPALQHLLQAQQPDSRPVAVLPYNYRLDAARRAALGPALAGWLGPGLRCRLQPVLAMGAEDRPEEWLPAALAAVPAQSADADGTPLGWFSDRGNASGGAAPPMLLVLLFPLAATPERESHGAVVQALQKALAAVPQPRPQLRVAVDESGYRQRLAGADAQQRLAQRRAAWESMLMGLGMVPGFVSLGAAPAG